jgi:hypothetical protein
MMKKTITAIMFLTIIATISMGNAYAIQGDGTSHVVVDSYPFNITILEGGSMTLHNNGTQTIDFVSNGWFEGSVPVNGVTTFEFPIVNCGTICFGAGMYYVNDLNGGAFSTITIVKPVVVEPIVEEIIVEEIIVEETIVVETTGIQNVATYEGDVDALALQKALAEVTANFNNSVEKIAEQKSEIELLTANLVVAVDTTSLDSTISELRANNTALANDITVITADRDEWKSLAENWYGVAMAQLKVMVNILGL